MHLTKVNVLVTGLVNVLVVRLMNVLVAGLVKMHGPAQVVGDEHRLLSPGHACHLQLHHSGPPLLSKGL